MSPSFPSDLVYHFEVTFFFLVLKRQNKYTDKYECKLNIPIFYKSILLHYDYHFDIVPILEQNEFLKSHY